jgi:hypothetical protein
MGIFLTRSRDGSSSPAAPAVMRAAIVDQLAITDPNPDFVMEATGQLEAAGYIVDYYPPDAVTVELYRNLPKQGYEFIILRSHASDFTAEPTAPPGAPGGKWAIGLFTNELYSPEAHLDEQYAKRVSIQRYEGRDNKDQYFGVNADFVSSSMHGRFDGTTVVLMGCGGLLTTDLAAAFVQKGAKDFVSWDRSVTATHTDAATEGLLDGLFKEHMGVRDAVGYAMARVGADPAFGAHLLAYP